MNGHFQKCLWLKHRHSYKEAKTYHIQQILRKLSVNHKDDGQDLQSVEPPLGDETCQIDETLGWISQQVEHLKDRPKGQRVDWSSGWVSQIKVITFLECRFHGWTAGTIHIYLWGSKVLRCSCFPLYGAVLVSISIFERPKPSKCWWCGA